MPTCGGLFDGIGLLAYGLHLAGWEHRWLCEVDEFRQGVLRQRFPGVPVYPDVRLVGGDAERVDLVVGGFPCKGASTAGKREGLDHPETALWREMHRVVRDLRPRFVLIENVANLLSLHRGAVWGEVLGDLAACGYDTEWDCLPAAAFGAPHLRDRVFAIATFADSGGERRQQVARGTPGDEAAAVGGGRLESDADHEPPSARQGGLHAAAASDTDLARADADAAAGGPRPPARERDQPPADASRLREGRAGAQAGADRERVGAGDHAAAHAASERREGARPGRAALARAAADRGVAVDWGDYQPAIDRWQHVHGPAPEPLVRRVDARGTARVERSRLSALGDGVLVHAGWFMGRLVMDRLLESSERAA